MGAHASFPRYGKLQLFLVALAVLFAPVSAHAQDQSIDGEASVETAEEVTPDSSAADFGDRLTDRGSLEERTDRDLQTGHKKHF